MATVWSVPGGPTGWHCDDCGWLDWRATSIVMLDMATSKKRYKIIAIYRLYIYIHKLYIHDICMEVSDKSETCDTSPFYLFSWFLDWILKIQLPFFRVLRVLGHCHCAPLWSLKSGKLSTGLPSQEGLSFKVAVNMGMHGWFMGQF